MKKSQFLGVNGHQFEGEVRYSIPSRKVRGRAEPKRSGPVIRGLVEGIITASWIRDIPGPLGSPARPSANIPYRMRYLLYPFRYVTVQGKIEPSLPSHLSVSFNKSSSWQHGGRSIQGED